MTVRSSIRPSALQGYQYEVAHTWDNPVLYPAFLARIGVTRVLAKTTQVKNYFFSKTIVRTVLNLTKIANIYTVKVEGEKFKLRTEICL